MVRGRQVISQTRLRLVLGYRGVHCQFMQPETTIERFWTASERWASDRMGKKRT